MSLRIHGRLFWVERPIGGPRINPINVLCQVEQIWDRFGNRGRFPDRQNGCLGWCWPTHKSVTFVTNTWLFWSQRRVAELNRRRRRRAAKRLARESRTTNDIINIAEMPDGDEPSQVLSMRSVRFKYGDFKSQIYGQIGTKKVCLTSNFYGDYPGSSYWLIERFGRVLARVRELPWIPIGSYSSPLGRSYKKHKICKSCTPDLIICPPSWLLILAIYPWTIYTTYCSPLLYP